MTRKKITGLNIKQRCLGLGLILLVLLFPLSAFALDPIPEKSGFSGFIRLGGGVMKYKSNMVAGNDFLDITDSTITSNTAGPDSDTQGMPTFDGKLAYTFASTRTQLTLGSSIEDIARLENAQQLAVKQELPDKSIISLGALFTGIPSEVWKDPYLTNAEREKTDRESKGAKFAFANILGSKLEFVYSYRKIEIDDEQSGINDGTLTAAERNMLRRDGKNQKASLFYRFNFNKTHILEPGITWFDQDRDGEAFSNDGYEAQLTYLYLGDPITLVATGALGKADFEKENPLYNQTQENDLYLLGLQAYYKDPFGWKPFESATLSLYCGMSYFYEDANIDFYDTELGMVDAGIMIRF